MVNFLNLLDRLNNRALGARSHDGLSLAEAQTQHQTAGHLVNLVNQTEIGGCGSHCTVLRLRYSSEFGTQDTHIPYVFHIEFAHSSRYSLSLGSRVQEAIVKVETCVKASSVAQSPAHTNLS